MYITGAPRVTLLVHGGQSFAGAAGAAAAAPDGPVAAGGLDIPGSAHVTADAWAGCHEIATLLSWNSRM
jgi:hypothetical protein